MAKLDPLAKAEDEKVLSEFLLDSYSGFKNSKTIFSKVATIPKATILKLHEAWEMPSSEKRQLIEWHSQNTENTNKDFIYFLVESFEVGLLEDTITALRYAYDAGYGLSVESLYTALEIVMRDGLYIEWAVEMSAHKSAEEIAKSIEEDRALQEKKSAQLEKNKITFDKLMDKWDK